jgi:hypothetical protein
MPHALFVADSSALRLVGRWAALGLVLQLGACAHVGPAEVPGSPAEKRLAVVKGTTPGIPLLPVRRAGAGPDGAAPPSATPASAPAGAPAPASATEATAGTAFSLRRLLGGLSERLGPPTGRSLAEQKRLDAPDQGIPLPTAGSGNSK